MAATATSATEAAQGPGHLLRSGPEAGVLTLRLNRPARLNALTTSLAAELLATVRAADADPEIRVLLLIGEGRAFCAGKDRDDPASIRFVDLLQQIAAALLGSPKPIVAAVQGWAVGAGLELLLDCDIVVAARDARFSLPEVKVGLFGTGGVHALLPRKIGLAKAKGVLLLGETFTAEQAERWGLLWELADDAASAQARGLAIARQLAAGDADSQATLKRLLQAEVLGDVTALLGREAAVHVAAAPPDRPERPEA